MEEYDWKAVIPAYEKLWQKLSKLSKEHKIKRNHVELFMPKYFDSFRHYPTKFLDSKTRIAITKSGLLFLKIKKLPFKIQEELLTVVSINIIFIILAFLLEKKCATIGETENYTKNILKINADISRYNIMWMLKKDLLMLLYKS